MKYNFEFLMATEIFIAREILRDRIKDGEDSIKEGELTTQASVEVRKTIIKHKRALDEFDANYLEYLFDRGEEDSVSPCACGLDLPVDCDAHDDDDDVPIWKRGKK